MLRRVSLRALLAIGPLAVGCDFFQELEDADSADTGDSEGESGTEGDAEDGSGGEQVTPCTIAEDDHCENQDVVASCDPATGLVTSLPCGALCGDNANLSCVATMGGQHGCWCVVPGRNKLSSCSQLGQCLTNCTEPGPCSDACFSKTTETTIRMYGALVHCAETSCESTCQDAPAACSPCVTSAIANGEGCTVERAICDADQSEEDWGYPG